LRNISFYFNDAKVKGIVMPATVIAFLRAMTGITAPVSTELVTFRFIEYSRENGAQKHG
jgi:hypothetical protein